MFGISLGSTATVSVDSTGEIYRNELGGHTTASLVAFTAEGRQLGEAAVMGLSANAKGTATEVGRLALVPYATLASEAAASMRHIQWNHAAGNDGSLTMQCAVGAEPRTVSSVSLLGALLGKVRTTSGAPAGAPLTVALPACTASGTTDDEMAAAEARMTATLADASAIGGWSLVATVSAADALGLALARKWPFSKEDEGGESKLVLVVDMGSQTTITAIVKLTPPTGGEVSMPATHEIVASRVDGFLGASVFDEALFDHFAAQIESKYGEGVQPASRRGLRLSTATEKLRKLLSTMKEASATAENLIDGIDVPLTASRDELLSLCTVPLSRLRTMLDELLTAEQLPAGSTLAAVETVGGGCRMPSVQQVLSDALAASACGAALAMDKPGAKLDDASLSTGAALYGQACADKVPRDPGLPALVGAVDAEARAALVAAEAADADADAAAARRASVRNELEAFVLEARGLTSRKHGDKIDGSKLSPLLDSAEDWIYSDEGEAADVDGLTAKLSALQAEVAEVTAAYLQAVAEDKAAEESKLEAASAQAAAERAAAGEDEDHDTRKLKFPDRLRLVTKNKEEGTELFQGGNFRPAAARYNKALTHAAKFVDLSPDQRKEVDAVKLSLNLNIAQCWLKITDAENHLDQAIRACGDALDIDADSVKALFRRATAREAKGLYDEAKTDLKRAAELAPDDKAIPKLLTRVDAQIARQKAKEKKMYGKMFG